MRLLPDLPKLLFILMILFPIASWAQDLNCDVTVNADQIQTSDRRVFLDMETTIENFMNGRDWTPDEFSVEERIKCTLSITLVDMPSIGSFKATVQIRSSRPIFNTSYESILFNFADRDWAFTYVESMPLDFNQNSYTSNLTSMLAFYAYVVLGLDYDSYGELAGDQYYQIAQVIVNNAAQSNFPGWSALESTRSRFALIDDLTNPQMQVLRTGIYKYHRLGLDLYEENPEKTRANVLEVLESIREIKSRYPASIFVISFFDAKTDELVNIFDQASMQEKRKAYNLLVELNPNKTDVYSRIIN
ncbi:MAG: DUF4835 domain-containing protein [Bacteroidetes bacterium]|nr:MAG: DUF4835 domain-containing protein [Bacteroidota bacterium]